MLPVCVICLFLSPFSFALLSSAYYISDFSCTYRGVCARKGRKERGKREGGEREERGRREGGEREERGRREGGEREGGEREGGREERGRREAGERGWGEGLGREAGERGQGERLGRGTGNKVIQYMPNEMAECCF